MNRASKLNWRMPQKDTDVFATTVKLRRNIGRFSDLGFVGY